MTEQKSDAELLPCPFCGDTMENHLGLVRHKENRPCVISAMGVDESAIPAWNHRSSPAGEIIRGEEERLRAAVRMAEFVLSMEITPIRVKHAGANNGKSLLRCHAAARSFLAALTNKEGSNNG